MIKTSATSGKALSLHLGLNAVSAAHYSGWSGEFVAAGRSELMAAAVASRDDRDHQPCYDRLQADVAKEAGRLTDVDADAALAQSHQALVSDRLTAIAAKCKAAVILISGCQDNQT